MPESELITTRDVARRYGVAVGTVQAWVRQGRIPCIRPSRRVIRFRIDDIERVIGKPAEKPFDEAKAGVAR